MIINWFRIKNFRSIIDSGICYKGAEITILAGKNESGKSNILKALECFGEDKLENNSPQSAGPDVYTEIEIDFKVSLSELEDYFVFPDTKESEFNLTVTKYDGYITKYSGSAYELVAKELNQNLNELKAAIVSIIEQVTKLTKKRTTLTKALHVTTFKKKLNEYLVIANNSLPNLSNEIQIELTALLKDIQLKQTECDSQYELVKKVHNQLSEILPKFVLFDSFDDILPESITLEQAKTSKIIERFCKVSKLDYDSLFNETDGQKRKQTTDKVSATVSGSFNDYYKQDSLKLKIHLDGPKLFFYIYDSDEITPFKPEQRSKGLQWFISFFLTLNAESTSNRIILIDEPGLFLHAKAQEDILKVLENLSTNQQVIFTTHSPYLIDPNRLDRVRLVQKDKKNHTKIENKVHKGADKDTLTPIITAIGLDITKSISFSSVSNVLLEGMSDYYYLTAMRKYLGENCPLSNDVNLIPNVGADQIPNMAALLIGWGIDFKVLLDNDSKGSSVASKLSKSFQLDNSIVILLEFEGVVAIEDMFSQKDFDKYVLKVDQPDAKESNSKKAKSLDKILIAKSFCEAIHSGKVGSIKLDKKTTTNFTKVFDKLK